MFFANALKDYVDQLNDLALLLNDNFTVFAFLKSLSIYLFDSSKLVLVYFFSCQWLTDFIELPCRFKANYLAILEGNNLFETNLNPTFFEFLETKSLTSKGFVTGFLNSFFLALPLSVPHLLTLRAFLINGLPAGVSAAAGTILGQFTFFACVFFGFEYLVLPFLSFEPLNYIAGSIIVVNVLYNMVHKPNMEVLNTSSDLNLLVKFFGLNFVLAWTEQTSLFQYFGNLTVNNSPTLLQGFSEDVSSVAGFFLSNGFYLIGILLGSILWTAFFGFILTLLRNQLSKISKIPFMFLNDRIHKGVFVLTFTLCLSSVPYYGFDYLVSAPLGFLSQDKALDFIRAKTYYGVEDLSAGGVIAETFVNPIPFDRTSQLERVAKNSYLNTFEDYSINSENFWKNRMIMSPKKMARFETTRKSTSSSSYSEIEQQNQSNNFLDDFYKSIKIDEKNKISKLEENIDTMASFVFNPIAYDYYNLNLEDYAYTRKQFREKFYNNLVYKALVHLDMVGFLQGQPKFYSLTPKDEMVLYQRRVVFENYLNSIQEYKNLVIKEQNTSPYAEKVYNQQFKGSLDLVRHYFAISLAQNTDRDAGGLKKVLKFDQPLYKNSLTEWNSFLHEELDFSSKEKSLTGNFSQVLPEKQRPQSKSNELNQNDETRFALQRSGETDSTPFYMGWDGSLRKFLVKKACIPGIPFGNEAFSKEIQPAKNASKLPTYLSFQSWAFNSNNLKKVFDKGISLPYIPLSEESALKVAELFQIQDSGYNKANFKSNLLLQQNLPPYNWSSFLASSQVSPILTKELNQYIDLGNALPPQLGGFAWPGVKLNELTIPLLKQK
uniref:Hypothetical chloroplast RF1 n=1 Tax=Sarcinofilum mucosum TaxID=141643 RepID=A0A1W6EGC2_SARMC|nr:hypothetical chloroplast RF1 [Sarcinofilum mucosum]ARK14443.1 hypothetical chloroplast RF1 [Sarcinofilum mucosum]